MGKCTALLRIELVLLLVALQFLTRVPVRFTHFEPAWLNPSARYFPLVGAVVGAFGGVVLWGAAQLWSVTLCVALSMAATIWLTGGFHEDGLADTCDALGGAVSRQRALEIMKDSRIGTYAALGLILTLTLKGFALIEHAHRSIESAMVALVLGHTLSRSVVVCLLATLRYAGDVEHAKAKPMAEQVSPWSLGTALSSGLLCLGAMIVMNFLTIRAACGAMLSAAAAGLFCRRWLLKRLGGYTGDTLGATQQWSELAIYLALSANFSNT